MRPQSHQFRLTAQQSKMGTTSVVGKKPEGRGWASGSVPARRVRFSDSHECDNKNLWNTRARSAMP
jgi:hypothetical protein